jgi:hypothetical protein
MKVVTVTRVHPDARCASELGAEAKRGTVLAYADVGQPDKAYQFLKRIDPERSEAWLADLVDELMRRGQTREACAAALAGPQSATAARERAGCR